MRTDLKTNTPELSVLIVSYNSAGDLKRCLDSLQSHLKTISHEICVIDNGSSDQSASLVLQHYPAVQLIRNPENLGFAAAINQGIRSTRAPYLFWINPDSEIVEGDIRTLLDYFQMKPEAGIVGIKIINPDGSLQLSARSFPSYATAFFNRYSLLSRLFPKNPFTQKYLGTHWDHNEIRSVDWVSGAGLLHRRDLSEKIGLLDETFFMYCEDVDFCFRASRMGWEVIYHPGLMIRHAIGGSSKSAPRRMILERHKSIWYYYKKHFRRNLFKDALTASGIFLRCIFLITVSFSRKVLS